MKNQFYQDKDTVYVIEDQDDNVREWLMNDKKAERITRREAFTQKRNWVTSIMFPDWDKVRDCKRGTWERFFEYQRQAEAIKEFNSEIKKDCEVNQKAFEKISEIGTTGR